MLNLLKKWWPRILAQIPVIGFAVLDDQFDTLLPRFFLDWKRANMIEFIVIIFLLLWATNMTVSWWRRKCEATVFDMSASDVAEYIKEHLGMDITETNKFVKQMAIENKVQVRAVRNGESIHVIVKPTVFTSDDIDVEIVLVGTNEQRQVFEHFGCAFHEQGWIANRTVKELNDRPLYVSPRFNFREIRDVVSWYKKSTAR